MKSFLVSIPGKRVAVVGDACADLRDRSIPGPHACAEGIDPGFCGTCGERLRVLPGGGLGASYMLSPAQKAARETIACGPVRSVHATDADCVASGTRRQGDCNTCGVSAGDPCPDCGGIRYHQPGCAGGAPACGVCDRVDGKVVFATCASCLGCAAHCDCAGGA